MKKIWLAALVLLALVACNSVIDPEQEVIDEPESPEAIAAAWRTPVFLPYLAYALVNVKGEMYVEGPVDNLHFDDHLLRKYSATGKFRWERNLCCVRDMAMGTDNKIYFLVQAGDFSDTKVTELNVYSTGGSRLRNINLTKTGRGFAWKMLLDKDNNVYVLYKSGEVVKYSPYGKELWSVYVGDPGAGVADPIESILDAQGNIKVFGLLANNNAPIATVSPQGQLLSVKPLSLTTGIHQIPRAVSLPNGSTAVVYWTLNSRGLFVTSRFYILDKDDQVVETHPLRLPDGTSFAANRIVGIGDMLTECRWLYCSVWAGWAVQEESGLCWNRVGPSVLRQILVCGGQYQYSSGNPARRGL